MTDANTSHEIARLRKNNRGEELVIALSEYNNHRLLNARLWVRNDAEQSIPTKNGWTLPAAMIPSLREALARAEAEARQKGWLPTDSA